MIPKWKMNTSNNTESNLYNLYTEEEAKMKDSLYEEKIFCLRRAAEVHREVRRYAQSFFRPGVKLVDAVKRLEHTL